MIVVIQCAAKKQISAGHMHQSDGTPILFVANPESAPTCSSHKYAKPDDKTDNCQTWRSQLLSYNRESDNNPLNLLPAWKLYMNPTYQRLVNKLGIENVYILSAGWGLISADFLTPMYDITFSASAEAYKRRRIGDKYDDFQMLPSGTKEQIVFLGGKDYIPLFCKLTEQIKAPRTIIYNSKNAPDAPDCSLIRYETTTRTNWHYGCANAILDGTVEF